MVRARNDREQRASALLNELQCSSRLPLTLTLGFCVAQYVLRALECQVGLSVSDAIPASQCGKIYLRLAVSM